jgi:transducin (beta)-like 1
MSPALKSPATASAASAVAKRNSVEDGLNGVTRKRRKKVTNGVDRDVSMPDAPSPAGAEYLPITNGRSVGTQMEDVVELSPTNDALVLSGAENGRIMSCAWNPTIPTMLATVTMQCAAVQIWTLPERATSSDEARNIVLSHEPLKQVTPYITIIKWSYQGDRLASGSYDGQTRIWSAAGVLLNTLWAHSAPISSCKWNKAGSYVCVMACDGRTIVWNAETGDPHQAFKPPPLEEILVEFEWISDSRFVGGGNKGNIYLHDIGEEDPLSFWPVHNEEVSCIAWDEPTETIATGGQDSTILVNY